MLKRGIINPHLLSLLARVRHTNAVVIADRGFPCWPGVEIIDLSLVDNVPTVLQVLAAIQPNFEIARAYMAREFKRENSLKRRQAVIAALGDAPLTFEPHLALKKRVPAALGLIRTGDTAPYANMLLVSG